MSPAIFNDSADDVAIRHDSGHPLAIGIEKLAELRFLIILTAHWEFAECVDAERRNRFSADLMSLHRQYFAKIDEIAMSYGVQQAMDAQKMVERTVTVPHCSLPASEPSSDDHGWF